MNAIRAAQHRVAVATVRLEVVTAILMILLHSVILFSVHLHALQAVSAVEALAEDRRRAACHLVVSAVGILLLQVAVISVVADGNSHLPTSQSNVLHIINGNRI